MRKSLDIIVPKCKGCGACCRGLDVAVYDDDMIPPELVVKTARHGSYMKQVGPDQACVALDQKTNRCTIYSRRPLVCVEFERNSEQCRQAVRGYRPVAPSA